jgi:pantoate--beta-alanine ligase
MEILKTVLSIKGLIEELKSRGKTVGFVPTMGALHEGHLSLVNYAKANNDYVVVSIFVNPTQFNDKNDLKNYPRTFDSDAEKLRNAGVDIIFSPTEHEMYPEPDTRLFDFGLLDKVMEGKHRPGHFNGVAQIVSKLFDAVMPHKAYFGEKDFQQLAIIKQLVKRQNYNIEIVSCPIIREADGLAMSSRNVLLSSVQRVNAAHISKTLFESSEMAKSLSVDDLKKWVYKTINENPELEVEYFEIVDDTYLQPIKNWDEKNNKVGCIAVKVGRVRLIDNIKYNL